MAYSCLVELCVPCMTCDVPHVSKAVGARESFKRHEAHGGIGSFTQNITELEVIRTETTIG
jgi:hypothetical protein